MKKIKYDLLGNLTESITYDEEGKETVFYVEEIKNDSAILTINHPLAGMPLLFNANIVSVRSALNEEIESKMAFGAKGDQKPSSCSCC